MGTPDNHPRWELTYDETGQLTSSGRSAVIGEIAAAGVEDLFVLCHGWNNQATGAEKLYDALIPKIATAAEGRLGAIGFAGVVWPAIWFPDTPTGAPQATRGAALAAESENVVDDADDPALTAPSGTDIAAALCESYPEGDTRRDTIARLGELIDAGLAAVSVGTEPDSAQRSRLDTFRELLQTLVPDPATGAEEDNGETKLLRTDSPQSDYANAARVFGSAPPGSATQGIGDGLGAAWNGAKDVLRVWSFYTMKARAGDIGRAGLSLLLEDLHTAAGGIRVHLVGHSFGARLVSYALAGTSSAAASPVGSLTLLQGAFSHWTFAHKQDNPFDKDGELHAYADRVHGPLVATFSEHDWAVCNWYPKASFLARQDTSANNPASRWGGMGADGYQAVNPAEDLDLQEDGDEYALTSGTFYRINGAQFINNTSLSVFAGAHSDIVKPEVAWLVVSAALSGEPR
jgi:hypothetical protein